MEFVGIGFSLGAGKAGRDGIDKNDVSNIENGMGVFLKGDGWGNGLRSVRSGGDDSWSEGSHVEPDCRGTGAAVEGKHDRALVAVLKADAFIGNVEDGGTVIGWNPPLF